MIVLTILCVPVILLAILRVLCYRGLRVSELPVLLLALFAGSAERKRLRLLLAHREQREKTRDDPPAAVTQETGNLVPVGVPAPVTPLMQEHKDAQTDLRRKMSGFQRRLTEGPRQPDTTVPATASQYATWLRGYTGRGGRPTHFYDYPFNQVDFRYAASSPLVVESDYEYGANSREIIIAPGVKAQRTHPGEPFDGWAHSNLYFMDGYRARANFVPVYSDPEFDFARRPVDQNDKKQEK